VLQLHDMCFFVAQDGRSNSFLERARDNGRGAADCSYWIRKLKAEAQHYELTEGRRISVARASRILSNALSCTIFIQGTMMHTPTSS